MLYPIYRGKLFPVLRDGCEVLRRKNSQILKEDKSLQVSSSDPLSRDRSVESWRVKCVVLGEIHFNTNLLLNNSNVHTQDFIFYLELAK